jgi:hypothetical protein
LLARRQRLAKGTSQGRAGRSSDTDAMGGPAPAIAAAA